MLLIATALSVLRPDLPFVCPSTLSPSRMSPYNAVIIPHSPTPSVTVYRLNHKSNIASGYVSVCRRITTYSLDSFLCTPGQGSAQLVCICVCVYTLLSEWQLTAQCLGWRADPLAICFIGVGVLFTPCSSHQPTI